MALTKVSAAMFSTAAQTSDLNLDDGTLFIDSSENKVAIGNTAPAEALDITGNLTLRSRGYVKLQDASGGQFVALRAPATVSSSVTWSLPAADGSSGQSLVTDGSGALTWQTNYLTVSAGTVVTVSSNTISIGQAVATSDSPTFTNLTLSGNLTVNGSTVTNSATNTTIEDLLIELGTGTSGSPSSDAGIVIERGSSDNVFISSRVLCILTIAVSKLSPIFSRNLFFFHCSSFGNLSKFSNNFGKRCLCFITSDNRVVLII